MTDEHVPKVVLLPGATLNPAVVLNRTTDKISSIKSVVVVIQWDDGSYGCEWSSMNTSELCMAKDCLTLEVYDVIRDVPE